MQRLVGQAAGHQQPGQLAQVATHAGRQPTAAFEQGRVDLAGHQQGGEHRLAAQAHGRFEQAIVTDDALALVPEQLAVAADLQA